MNLQNLILKFCCNKIIIFCKQAKKEKQDAIAAGKDITEKKDKKDPKGSVL